MVGEEAEDTTLNRFLGDPFIYVYIFFLFALCSNTVYIPTMSLKWNVISRSKWDDFRLFRTKLSLRGRASKNKPLSGDFTWKNDS